MRQTNLSRLIEMKLGRSLAVYVATARANGRDWRGISDDLRTATGIYASHETIRSWFSDDLQSVGA